jgi:YHS domain-containing protein
MIRTVFSSVPSAPSALLCVLLAACGGSTAGAPGANAPTTQPSQPSQLAATKDPLIKAPGEAKPGDKTTCPVSGEEFVVDASSPKVELNGKTYYFCCSGCDKKFQANPAKFLAPKT